jgi:hypothetical protein
LAYQFDFKQARTGPCRRGRAVSCNSNLLTPPSTTSPHPPSTYLALNSLSPPPHQPGFPSLPEPLLSPSPLHYQVHHGPLAALPPGHLQLVHRQVQYVYPVTNPPEQFHYRVHLATTATTSQPPPPLYIAPTTTLTSCTIISLKPSLCHSFHASRELALRVLVNKS